MCARHLLRSRLVAVRRRGRKSSDGARLDRGQSPSWDASGPSCGSSGDTVRTTQSGSARRQRGWTACTYIPTRLSITGCRRARAPALPVQQGAVLSSLSARPSTGRRSCCPLGGSTVAPDARAGGEGTRRDKRGPEKASAFAKGVESQVLNYTNLA